MPAPQEEQFGYPPGIDQGIVRFRDVAYQVADTSLSLDGAVLRQWDETRSLLAIIDTTRPFRWTCWIDRGARVIEVRQDNELLLFTSILEGWRRVSRDILRIGDPDNWSS